MANIQPSNPCRQIIVHQQFPLPRARPVRRVDWNHLPIDLLLQAAHYLDAQDLCRLSVVNRACR